jgi:hypothetical protein
MSLQTLWLEGARVYDGTQLRAHWILRTAALVGDALVAFRGPCRLPASEIADLEDVAGPGIAGDDMLHFVGEIFDDGDLVRAVLRQRLLAADAVEVLRRLAPGKALSRRGDDLFFGERKLSISVATRSTVSTLIHFAVNVGNAGTPVATAALADLGVEPRAFADALLERAAREQASLETARCKVRPRPEA